MHTSRAGRGPELVNPCGTPAGPITMSPGPPSRASPPTLTRTRPSRITKGLVVGMMMQPGSLAGLVVHQEERHRARAMPTALEGARNLVARQVTVVHVIHPSNPPHRWPR